MHARDRKKGPGNVRVTAIPCLDNASPFNAGFQIMGALASQFTGAALNASSFIKIKTVLHSE
jgi:hypothetical protein